METYSRSLDESENEACILSFVNRMNEYDPILKCMSLIWQFRCTVCVQDTCRGHISNAMV